jgi:pyrroline-5-carboxylate reductase
MMKGNVLVIGAGKMIEAILVGLKASVDMSHFYIYSPSGVSAEKLSRQIGARHASSLEGIHPDWVILGCKPQQIEEAKKLMGERFASATFISVLAALPEEVQRLKLNVSKLVRVMPNLPVRYQQGVSLISSDSAKEEADMVTELFSKVGLSLKVQEKELEELTLLTGSGPAFFYEFARDLSRSFSSLDQVTREKLARAVLTGAGINVKHSSQDLSGMIDAVTSKGGVTIAALENFRESKLSGLVAKGMEAGKKRAQELKELILRS